VIAQPGKNAYGSVGFLRTRDRENLVEEKHRHRMDIPIQPPGLIPVYLFPITAVSQYFLSFESVAHTCQCQL
jgi:hypothetical protein